MVTDPAVTRPKSGFDPERVSRVQLLFTQAGELDPEGRDAFVRSACHGDSELLEAVRGLLAADSQDALLLDRGVAPVAQAVFEDLFPASLPYDLGPYRLLKLLGEGGMGVVYLGERRDLGNPVAIKILQGTWLAPSRIERFRKEQQVLASLNHPSIAQFFDAGVLADRTPYFVMEFVDGVPIDVYCREKALPVEERLRLFLSVCDAVQFAHRRAIIHRDLKPSNVLVRVDGATKLLDFGIAKHLEQDGLELTKTRTEARMLTPAYAAPEQLLGEPVGVFTDIYGLGLILFEILSGRRPCNRKSRSASEEETAARESNPDPPSVIAQRNRAGHAGHKDEHISVELGASDWTELDVLCLTAIHQDPTRRYPSVEALIRDVNHFLSGEPLEARPDSLRYKVGKFFKRNRRAAITVGVATMLLLMLSTIFIVRLTRAKNAEVAAGLRAQRVQRFMFGLFGTEDPSVPPSRDLRVLTLADRGVQEARTLNGEPEVQAELFLSFGAMYQRLGNLDRAERLMQAALAQQRSLWGEKDGRLGPALVALGLLRLEQARFAEAEKLVGDALSEENAAIPKDREHLTRATLAMARIQEGRGDYKRAAPLLQEALLLGSAGPAEDRAACLKELADVYFYSGQYDLAEKYTLQSKALHQSMFGPDHPSVAQDLINEAAIAEERGHYSEGEQLYRKSLSIDERWYGKGQVETAGDLFGVGKALVDEQRYLEAKPILTEALRLREQMYGPLHPKVANVVNELCLMNSGIGDYPEARVCYTRELQIYQHAFGEGHYLVGLALANIASMFITEKQYARAEPLLRNVLAIYAKTLPANHLYIGIAEIKLGHVLMWLGRNQEAEPIVRRGYEKVKTQAGSSVSWALTAQKDLQSIHKALNEPEQATEMR